MKAKEIIDRRIVDLVLERHKQEVRKNTDEEISNLLMKKQADMDALTLTVVRETCGFGKKRMIRFIKNWKKVYDYHNKRYDDADIYVMKRDLLAIGIDVDKIPEMYKEMEGAEQE